MDKHINMESDESGKQKKIGDTIVDDGDVLPPTRVRFGFLHDTKAGEFLFNYHIIFLPSITGFLWTLYLLF